MLNDDEKELINFVQKFAPDLLPAQKRIKVYRGLADSLEDKGVRALFVQRAEILAEAERRCAELNFTFTKESK